MNQKVTKDSLKLLHGSSTIVEILCGLKFLISPLSFFQTNTAAAEILYTSVDELFSPSPEVTVLDICCGTGTIGLCLAKVKTTYTFILMCPTKRYQSIDYIFYIFLSNVQSGA